MEEQKLFEYTYSLEPADVNGQKELPLTLLVKRILEVATLHAESWNAGYSTLIKTREAWVLSRLVVEMYRYPQIQEEYTLQTWVESYNRHFSARNFTIYDKERNVCGYAQTIWVVINLDTRESLDITQYEYIARNVCPEKKIEIAPQSRIRNVADEHPLHFDIKYSDIDLNRHFNSVKYVEHIVDLFPLERFDRNRVGRFEISFMNEAGYGETVELYRCEESSRNFTAEMRHGEKTLCRSRIVFVPR